MTNFASTMERLAEYQGQLDANGKPRFLFRGHNEIHSDITSKFKRKTTEKTVESGQAFTVFRRAAEICRGLQGYSLRHLDGLAVLQHYGWPTPLIDFTGTAEVAAFFALLDATVDSHSVVYVLDCQKLPEDAIVIDHEFLTHKLADGGLRHRWLRQDGFAVTIREWREADKARSFDLLAPPFQSAISEHAFTVSPSDRANIADLLSIKGDPIPAHLQELLRIFCRHQFPDGLTAKLCSIVDEMWRDPGLAA